MCALEPPSSFQKCKKGLPLLLLRLTFFRTPAVLCMGLGPVLIEEEEEKQQQKSMCIFNTLKYKFTNSWTQVFFKFQMKFCFPLPFVNQLCYFEVLLEKIRWKVHMLWALGSILYKSINVMHLTIYFLRGVQHLGCISSFCEFQSPCNLSNKSLYLELNLILRKVWDYVSETLEVWISLNLVKLNKSARGLGM